MSNEMKNEEAMQSISPTTSGSSRRGLLLGGFTRAAAVVAAGSDTKRHQTVEPVLSPLGVAELDAHGELVLGDLWFTCRCHLVVAVLPDAVGPQVTVVRVAGLHLLHDVRIVVQAHPFFVGDGIMASLGRAIAREERLHRPLEKDRIRIADHRRRHRIRRWDPGVARLRGTRIVLRGSQRLVLAGFHDNEAFG